MVQVLICFNTCSSCEEQLGPAVVNWKQDKFQYMLLLRGATQTRRALRRLRCVSIHAPLARSNYSGLCSGGRGAGVSIHAPLARSNSDGHGSGGEALGFNTRSSCEEQLACPNGLISISEFMFQYMLLLRGATQPQSPERPSRNVSIHAPLARSNSLDRLDILF